MTGEFAIAVHAIVYLNRHPGMFNSMALAQNVCTNPARIRKVMSKLKRAQLVDAKEGAVGGYRFLRDPKQTSLLEIFEAVGQPMVGVSWRSGDPDIGCMVASGMAGVMDAIYREMDACCRKRLAEITIHDVDRLLSEKIAHDGKLPACYE